MLKRSQGELQVCFKPHPNRRSGQRVMTLQSPGSPNRHNFGSPETKSQLDVGVAERHREYYMGEDGGFPRV